MKRKGKQTSPGSHHFCEGRAVDLRKRCAKIGMVEGSNYISIFTSRLAANKSLIGAIFTKPTKLVWLLFSRLFHICDWTSHCRATCFYVHTYLYNDIGCISQNTTCVCQTWVELNTCTHYTQTWIETFHRFICSFITSHPLTSDYHRLPITVIATCEWGDVWLTGMIDSVELSFISGEPQYQGLSPTRGRSQEQNQHPHT